MSRKLKKKFYLYLILFSSILLIYSCGVKQLSKKDCAERKSIKVYVIPYRLDEYDFDTYSKIEDDLLFMCYSVVSRSKTLSGNIIHKDLIYKRIYDSLSIKVNSDWRTLTNSQIRNIGKLLKVDYVVTGTTRSKPAYKSTEFFTTCDFIDVNSGEIENLYDDKFIGKIIYENQPE